MKILKLLMNETFAPTSSNSQIEKHCRAIDFAYGYASSSTCTDDKFNSDVIFITVPIVRS